MVGPVRYRLGNLPPKKVDWEELHRQDGAADFWRSVGLRPAWARALAVHGILTWEQLRVLHYKELALLPGVGPQGLAEIWRLREAWPFPFEEQTRAEDDEPRRTGSEATSFELIEKDGSGAAVKEERAGSE